jgi:tetratricopeptide (TPR) repeat protein
LSKRILTIIILIFCIAAFAPSASAEPYIAFTYSSGWGPVQCPVPYLPSAVISTTGNGIILKEPKDLFVDKDGNMYIANSGGSSVVYLSADGHEVREIREFDDHNGLYDLFKNPEGIFVAENGNIYVADTGNKRIVKFNSEFKCLNIIKLSQSDVLGEKYSFLPAKVVVDDAERVFVISKNDFQGVLEISQESDFRGYMGSNLVNPNPVELIWRRLMTQEQSNKLAQFIPYEFSNISMDKSGFVFAVSSSGSETKPIKRFNSSGQDILLRQTSSESRANSLTFYVDVAAHEDGNYSLIDYKTGKIFVYTHEGYLLYAFGGMGTLRGNFTNPTALCESNEKLYVLDMTTCMITVFEMTEYASKISEAQFLYNEGKYDESAAMWKEVLKENSGFELAYIQIGKVLLRQGKDYEAMEYFELGNYRGDRATKLGGFNEAFNEVRKNFIRSHIAVILLVIITLYIGMKLVKRAKRKRSREMRRYE